MADKQCLIITNGAVAAGGLKVNKAADAYLSWDDILFEGPVPLCDTLGELSLKRVSSHKVWPAAFSWRS